MKNSLLLFFLAFSGYCLSTPSKTATDSIIRIVNSNKLINLSGFSDLYDACENEAEFRRLFNKIDLRIALPKYKALNRIAFALAIDKRGNHELAMGTMLELKNIEQFGKYINAEYYGAIGQINYSSENPEMAKVYHLKSIKLLLNSDQKVTLHRQYMRLGQVCSALEDYEEAIANYEKAKAIDAVIPSKQILYLKLNCAMTSTSMGRNSEAKIYFKEAIEEIRREEDYFAEIRTYRNLGDIYLKEDSLVLAEEFYLKGFNLATKRQFNADLIGFNYALAILREKQSRFQDAYQYYRIYDSLRESVHLVETAQSVIQLEMENKLSMKRMEKEAQDKLLISERESNRILLGSSLILLLFLVTLIRQVLIVRQKNRVLLRKNLAEDLRLEKSSTANYEKKRASDFEPLIKALEQLIFEDQFFQKLDLTQEKIAKKLGTNRTYLSEAINCHYKMGYSRWINEVRIKASKNMLIAEKYANYSIEGISKSVGFSSLSTFNSNFKAITGLTPSYYRNNYLSSIKSGAYSSFQH